MKVWGLTAGARIAVLGQGAVQSSPVAIWKKTMEEEEEQEDDYDYDYRVNKSYQKKTTTSIGCEKQSEEDEDEDEDDIISSLPDSILHHILSSVDTKSAVQTSALCKRWRYVWISLPTLHFDYDDDFAGPPTEKMPRFAHFVNRVLSLREPSAVVSRFYLWSTYHLDPNLVKTCVSYAFHHNVKELLLWAPYPKPLEFHSFGSLTSLALVCNDFSTPPDKPLQLPALRRLHFSCCSYGCGNFLTETVGNCPNLETFILDDLILKSLNITAPNLRNLELAYKDESCNESEIVVSAPRLTSFRLEGEASPVFSGAILPCLENVHVDLVPCFDDEWHPPDAGIRRRMPLNVINMLEQLREAKSVTLSLRTLEVLTMDPDSLNNRPPPFRKLKHLKLTSPSKSLHLPLNVMTYLTNGSLCDILVVEFP